MLKELSNLFGDCNNQSECNCVLKSSFEETTAHEFFIYDSPTENRQPCRLFIDDNFPIHLSVNNPTKKKTVFIKTDKCLFTDATKKCDCVLINDATCVFVEIKTGGMGTRSTKRKEAVKQLETTIQLFQEKNYDLRQVAKIALICFKTNKNYPTKASLNTNRVDFSEKYNVSLQEGNLITL